MKANTSAVKADLIRVAARKDRHSKVWTARGTRERRVRLSPKTAILFYDVQDRLGYDRPSKAIDWLISEAKPAIDALAPPPTTAAAAADSGTKNHHNFKTDIQEHHKDFPSVSAGFGFFSEDYDEEQLLPPLPNSEAVWVERILYANAIGEEEDYSNFHMREPLQSSRTHFQGFRFSNDQDLLPDFGGASTFQG